MTPGVVQWKFREREDSMNQRTEGSCTPDGNHLKKLCKAWASVQNTSVELSCEVFSKRHVFNC